MTQSIIWIRLSIQSGHVMQVFDISTKCDMVPGTDKSVSREQVPNSCHVSINISLKYQNTLKITWIIGIP